MRFAGLLFVPVFVLFSAGSILFPPTPPAPETVDPPAWDPPGALAVTLGRGWEDFRPHDGDDGVPLTSGFQGGQHVHVTILSPDLPAEDEGEVLSVITWFVDPATGETLDGAYETDGYLEPLPSGLVDDGHGDVGTPFPVAFLNDLGLRGREVELRVHVVASDGRVGQAQVTGVLDWEQDLPAWREWLEQEPDAGPATDGGPLPGGG